MAKSLSSAALTRMSSDASSLAGRIDALLPQTQCTRCGYPACRPYADALADGTTDLNRCPPGGTELIAALAALTGRAPRPLAPECGAHGPLRVAVIDEAACIGCTLCIQACPLDAIIGAQKRMHAVLPSLCSGCELCVPPCPVDCIALPPAARAWTAADASAARTRADKRTARLARGERIARRAKAGAHPEQAAPEGDAHDRARRQAAVAAALARARARRAAETKVDP
ncbi:MAG TPA: RnfABCDGE type electron transport complex subunit B [Casimicrobiaceae bacterium]|nr:RnfABCDGE type electron transport complex subunit B [Casimicrobiaceae bacterium]